MGEFLVKKTEHGFTFNLKAGNGEIILVSELYKSKESCKEGIASVKACAPVAAIEDQTIENFEEQKHPQFEIYVDKAEKFRFRLKAKNGEKIGASEPYESKESCEGGIESVRNNAPDAPLTEQ